MSSNLNQQYLAIAPVLRGAGFDGRRGPLVRCFEGVSGAGGPSVEIPESAAFVAGEPNVGAIVEAIAGFVDEHDAFPSRVIVGSWGYAVGERPDDIASFDGHPASGLQNRGRAFKGASAVSEAGVSTPNAGGQTGAGPAPATAGQAASDAGAVSGRVAVVTGGAQGFGLEIASSLAEAGAIVFLCDLNVEGATAEAAKLNAGLGRTCAFAVEVNVSDEASVRAMVAQVVSLCGGIDLFVSNAGVLRAGSVKELSAKDFAFVTNVNYGGFFLCAKQASPIMALQNRGAAARPSSSTSAAGGYYTDIVQINSKSGLEGSNKNGAYAGSKFGGIGLVQSFAMELVEDNIKVNAVCPGNFFDGPLWSDPEKGLFIQYLRAGKVPGAETVADVKRFYEEKVPMKRGCTGTDVVKAILYLVDQVYETGQALPVTGGQVMLH